MKQTPKTTQVNSKIIIAVAIMILAPLSLVIQYLIQHKQQTQPDIFVGGTTGEPTFSLSSNPSATTLSANASTVVNMKMSSGVGTVQTIAAKISWDPAKYTFDQTYGLRQASHGFNPVQTINTSEGFASVAYIPMVQGGDITLPGGNVDLFTIKLTAKVANPTTPAATGTYDGFVASSSCGNNVCESGETATSCAVDCEQSSAFSISTNPTATSIAANASTVVTMKMSSTAGKAQTIAAKISWDPAKYTFDQTYGLRQASHGFNPVQTINTSEGFASVAYIPMVQGGDITVVSGNIDLFSIKLISKVSNPSMPVGTGQIEYVGDTNPSEQQACAAAGGTWREFSDGCADLCNRGSACTQAFTTSCDCPNGCWDATSKTCKTSDACSNVTCGTGQGCVDGRCVNSVPRCSANIYISKGEYEYRETVVGAAPLSAYIYVGGGVDGTGGIQGYQVDFEGDGTWDTDYFDPSPNGYITHTYTQTGTFTPKYRILTTLGSVSGACSYVNSIQVTSSTDPDPSQGLNIKAKLYKVSKPGVSIQAVVDVLPSGGNTPLQTKTVTFESDTNGVFRSGTVTSGTFTAGPIVFDLGNYTGDLAIRIKGPKHLRRRVNSIPGTNTNIDLTAYPLMPGDLPWNQTAQDGLANEYDLSAIFNNITSLTAPEASKLNIADVNYDGVVNLLDYSIVREVLLSRPDDN